MNVCGVIAEYDPFHRGHEYHLRRAREKSGADAVICVMSGTFTQRGAPAMLHPRDRAEMALRCGADIVLQLPYAFSVREAEYFALGGVRILSCLGCITHLSFGCETEDLDLLQSAADILENPTKVFDEQMQESLRSGQSYAAAIGNALSETLRRDTDILQQPNAALALCYVRALRKLQSDIQPVIVARQDAYHELEVGAFPSATAVRGALLRGDWESVREAVPEKAYPVLRDAVQAGRMMRPGALDACLRLRMYRMEQAEAEKLPGVREGLENRLLEAAKTESSWKGMAFAAKTRRYTLGRINRAYCHALMNVTTQDLPELPSCARLLGFRESAGPIVRRMKENFPIVTRPAREEWSPLDIRADEYWQIGAGLPLGATYRQQPVILRE